MTYSVSIQDVFGEWSLSGVFLHRQQALKEARRIEFRLGAPRTVVYEVNGVGDDRIIYDSTKDSIMFDHSTLKWTIIHIKK